MVAKVMKPISKDKKTRRPPLGQREVEIIRRFKEVIKLPVAKIASAVGRHKKTIYTVLRPSYKSQERGRREILTKKDVNLLLRTIRAMVQEAKARRDVTLAMVKKRTKIKASERCIREHLKKRSIKFRKLRSKPVLLKEDVKARFQFSARYKKNRSHGGRKRLTGIGI